MQAVENNHPEIILLDFDYKLEETYDLVDKIATRFPGVAVIVILPESKVQFSDRVILQGRGRSSSIHSHKRACR